MHIHRTPIENEERNTITVAGVEISGFVVESTCPTCGAELILDFQYDAHLCAECDVWTEPKCADPECGFCPSRPTTPLDRIRR